VGSPGVQVVLNCTVGKIVILVCELWKRRYSHKYRSCCKYVRLSARGGLLLSHCQSEPRRGGLVTV